MPAFLAEDAQAVMEGDLSNRVVFPGLGLDIRGVFDKYSADFQPETGTAVVCDSATIGIAYKSIAANFDDIEGATIRIYDPEFIGDDDNYVEYVCRKPRKYENTTVEIGLAEPGS